jgi:hypothetical protein
MQHKRGQASEMTKQQRNSIGSVGIPCRTHSDRADHDIETANDHTLRRYVSMSPDIGIFLFLFCFFVFV